MKRLFMNSCFNLISIFVGLIISMSLSLISNAKRVESPNVVFNEDKCEVSFAATMDDDGYYRVIVWVSPYRVIDEYVSYDVSINGILIKDALQFDKLGWQYSEVISKNGIYLKKGENTISIIGSLPVIPSIEHIEISNNDTYVSERINTILYKPENYILSGESIYSPADQEWQLLDPQYDAPYSYTYKLDVSCEYSFIKTMSLKKGEKLSISSNSPNNVSHAIDGKLTINYELDKISDIRITVNDITGSCLYDERFHERETGKHNKDLRLAINGTVIVHVVINDKVFFKRVMI